MKKQFLVVLLLAISCLSFGQTKNDKDIRSDEVFGKIREIDLLFNILPVLLTKDQINKILPALEQARAAVRKTRDIEYDEFMKAEPAIDKSIEAATAKNVLPSRQDRANWSGLIASLDKLRQFAVLQEIAIVTPVLEQSLSKTQLKVMANMVDPRVFDPKAKPDEMTQDQKLTLYVREILLDPRTYDLLVKMAKAG